MPARSRRPITNNIPLKDAAQQREILNHSITGCEKCPRLISHCRNIAKVKRKAYADDQYWGGPVPDMGPAPANLLIVGLAPGAHGANRTGRMFTGDRSGDWLFRAMHRAGFASQPDSTSRKDGLYLIDAAITAVCHCAPPDNKPLVTEIRNCQPFLHQCISLSRPRVLLALGSIAWKAVIRLAKENQWLERPSPMPKFGHAAKLKLTNAKPPATTATQTIQLSHEPTWLIGSYHPSQQNTFTGRLTVEMLDDVFRMVRQLIDLKQRPRRKK